MVISTTCQGKESLLERLQQCVANKDSTMPV